MKNIVNLNIIFIMASLALTLLLMPNKFEDFDANLNFAFPIIAFVNVVIFWISCNRFFASWIRFDTLFLLGFCIVHFQIPYLASLGIEPEDPNYIWINKMVVNYATWLSLVAMLLWLLGFLLHLKKKKVLLKSPSYSVNTKKIDLLLIIFFTAFIGLVGNEFLGGAYDGGNNWGANANYAFLLLSITLYLKVIYFFINTKNVKIGKSNILPIIFRDKLFFGILLVYVVVFLSAGDRGPVMEVAILMLGAYSIFQKKISFYVFGVLTFIGASIFTILSLGRVDDASDKNSNIFSKGYENFSQRQRSFNPTNELASTNRILFRAIDVVPSTHPYLNGLTMFSDLVSVVPFGGSTYSEVTNLPEMYKSSAYFFTVLGQGKYFTSGEGSEIVADIYINFGIVGVFLLMSSFGYFISFVSFQALYANQHVMIIVFLLILTSSIYMNRSSFLEPLKLITYGLFIDKYFTKKMYKKKWPN